MRNTRRPAKKRPQPSASKIAPRHRVRAFDDVQAMVVFARVVQLHSFSAAARDLALTTSAISKRIGRLEERLGARLLARTTRRVALTEAGASLFERCLRILREVEDAELLAANFSAGPRGLLRVTAPVYLGEVYVAPLLGELMRQYPELHIELSLNDRFVDLIEDGFDVALRVGRTTTGSLIARNLARLPMVTCAAPSYLAQRGEPQTPIDLAGHDCLRYTLETARTNSWRFRGAGGEMLNIPITSRLQSNFTGALREAALAGAGIVHIPRFYVSDAIAQGRLRPVLEAYVPPDTTLRGLYPAGRFVPPKTRAFIDWVAARLPNRLR